MGSVSPRAEKETKETATAVKASEPVITIYGTCEGQSSQNATASDPCATVVTREAFERLLDSMNVTGKPLTPQTRRNLAEVYGQYLSLERPAMKAGLDGTARFEEIMRWWRLRTLAGMYRGKLIEEFKSPSAEEVHAYYTAHLESYQRLKTQRILVPRTPGATEEAKRADTKALELADSARERAAKGEDAEVVQKDVYSALGLTSPTKTDLGTHPRSSFPREETDELFGLKAGQVSKVETEGTSYVIYKIVANDTQPEEAVREEISHQIAQDKYDAAVRSIQAASKPELNEAYFGPPVATPAVGTHP